MVFADRAEAGRLLAARVSALRLANPIVLALPRGGIAVGAEIAQVLQCPLDLAIAKKIGHPANPEAAIGAVSEDGSVHLDPRFESLVDPEWLTRETEAKLKEARSLRVALTGVAELAQTNGRDVVLTDDGIATGHTMFAALAAVRLRGPARIVAAVPIGPPDALSRLEEMADDVVVLDRPPDFYAVGAYYRDFRQVTDGEAAALLRHSKA